MSFEIKGRVIDVGPVEQISDKFKKRDLIVEYAANPQYPEEIKIEATQDRVSLFDNIYAGDEVEVSFNLRGRKWVNKDGIAQWFNSLVAWRVNKVTGSSQPAASTPPPASNTAMPPTVDISSDDDDSGDLPF